MANEKFKEDVLLTFSKSEVKRFRHANKALRWGQSFHQYFKLEKVVSETNKVFADRLYNETSEEKAKAMVASRIDEHN